MPLLEWMYRGTPNLHTSSFTRTSATVTAYWFGKGYASGHLENNLWLSGGTCSQPLSLVVVPAHLQQATLQCASGARIFFGGPFLEAHTSQALHQASVSL